MHILCITMCKTKGREEDKPPREKKKAGRKEYQQAARRAAENPWKSTGFEHPAPGEKYSIFSEREKRERP